MPDGHRHIHGFLLNDNVHFYILVSVFCIVNIILKSPPYCNDDANDMKETNCLLSIADYIHVK